MELRSGVKIPKEYKLKEKDLNKVKRKSKILRLTAKEVIYNSLIKNSTNVKYSVSFALCIFVFLYYITIAFKQ